MNIEILGNLGLYPKRGQPTSGYLIESGNCAILLEMGSGVFAELSARIPPERVSAYVLSHLHFDHSADLGVMGYYFESLVRGGFSAKIPLFAPDVADNGALAFLRGLGCFEIIAAQPSHDYRVGGLTLRFFPADHPVATNGCTFTDSDDCTFGFSGDSRLCDGVERIAERSDLFLCDAAFTEREFAPQKPHMCIRQAVELSQRYNVATLLTHFNPKADMSEVAREANAEGTRCIVSEVGKKYTATKKY